MNEVAESQREPALLDQLLEGCEKPEDLPASGGAFNRLRKRPIERVPGNEWVAFRQRHRAAHPLLHRGQVQDEPEEAPNRLPGSAGGVIFPLATRFLSDVASGLWPEISGSWVNLSGHSPDAARLDAIFPCGV
jgi:hypothetical protein